MIGRAAPEFATRNQYGQPVSLTDLRGAPALLVFFPYAFSGICSSELRQLRDQQDDFAQLGVRLLAVSCDPMFSLRSYADAEHFGFELLTDHWPHGAIAQSYGVFEQAKGCAQRGSFLIDPSGSVVWSWLNPMSEPRDFDQHITAVGSALTAA